jgi:uncharacterized SAM-binding protein YcdF (DUF218 family)
VLLAFVLVTLAVMQTVYPFLAINRPVSCDTLVVEGWVAPFAARGAVQEFRAGSYGRILTTGGPVVGDGGYTNEYNTVASVGAYRLKDMGIPEAVIQAVPSREIARDRTYSSAVALRDWARGNGEPLRRFNVVTENTHARRTLLLYKAAFGKAAEVGVIGVSNPDYDGSRWWQSSQGVKDVVGESFGYVYAKLFFFPKAAR